MTNDPTPTKNGGGEIDVRISRWFFLTHEPLQQGDAPGFRPKSTRKSEFRLSARDDQAHAKCDEDRSGQPVEPHSGGFMTL